MPYSTANGLRIYYEVYGEGPPLVLVHANPFDHRLWMYQSARYSAFCKVIAVDIRGYGRSDKPHTPFTLKDMSDDVLGVCATEGVGPAIFAGVSVGSGICLLIGLDHPEIVQALILVGGASYGGANMARHVEGYTSPDLARHQRDHLRACVAPAFPETPQGRWILDMFAENAASLSGPSIAQIFRARMGCDMRGRLKDLRVPALVVNGEHDMSFDAGKETASLAPGVQRAVIPGTGHACNIEDPATFDKVMTEFLVATGFWNGPAS